MAGERAEFRRVFRAFEESDWDEIHLSLDGVELHLQAAASSEVTESSDVYGPSAASQVLTPGSVPPAADATTAKAESTSTPVGNTADADVVRAPSPGIFWRSPSPGAPPFTDVGVQVEVGTPLCIVEVMKLMNTVPAPCEGTVVEVCVANGQQVDAGQALFLIRPGE